MTLTINSKELKRHLQTAKKIAPKKCAMPILAMAKVEISNSSLKITTTDLELHYCATLPISNPGNPWQGCLQIAPLIAALNTSESTICTASPDTLTINGLKLHSVPASEYPTFEVPASPKIATLDLTQERRDLLTLAAPAVSKDPTRYNLACWHFKGTKSGLTIEACDGHRLHSIEIKTDTITESALYPSKFFDVLSSTKSLDTLYCHKLAAQAESITEVLSARATDVTYPETSQVKPKRTSTTLRNINKQELISLLEPIASIAPKSEPYVKLEISEDIKLRATYSSPEHGTYSQAMNGFSLKGEPLTLGLNFRYLLEALTALPKSVTHVTAKFDGPLGPTIWQGLENTEVLIMPTRI